MQFNVPDVFLQQNFDVETRHTLIPQIHLEKLELPTFPTESTIVSPDVIRHLISHPAADFNTQIDTEFGINENIEIQQIKLQILKAIEQEGLDGLRSISREQIQMFIDEHNEEENDLVQLIREYFTRPTSRESIERDSGTEEQRITPLQRIRQLKETTRDKHVQGIKRYYAKKLIEILLGDIYNPYLGRMIFSQIGEKLTDYHRLKLNNSFAYFEVTKGVKNEVEMPLVTTELENKHLYAFEGRTIAVEHFEPFSLSCQLPGMAMRPSFVGYMHNEEHFKTIVENTFYNSNNYWSYPPISTENYISTYEKLKLYDHQFKPFFYQENMDYTIPFIEYCHGFAPFSSYRNRNRFLLTRNRNLEIKEKQMQTVSQDINKLSLSSSNFVLRELPFTFLSGEFIPQYNFELREPENKEAKSSNAESQPDPRMVVTDLYRKERSNEFYFRITQPLDDKGNYLEKKTIDGLASRIFPKDAKPGCFVRTDGGNKTVFAGSDDYTNISELTMHILIYENQVATCEYVNSFLHRNRFLNHFYVIAANYARYKAGSSNQEMYAHAWFMLDRFLGWVNLAQNFITNHKLAKYYTIQKNADVDGNTHVILDSKTYNSFAPNVFTAPYTVEAQMLKLLGFDAQTGTDESNWKKVENYLKQNITLSDPHMSNYAFNVNAMRIEQSKDTFAEVGETFEHGMTESPSVRINEIRQQVQTAIQFFKSQTVFKDESDLQICKDELQTSRRNSQDAEKYLKCLEVNVDLIKDDFKKRKDNDQQSEYLEEQIFLSNKDFNSEFNKYVGVKFRHIFEGIVPKGKEINNYLMDIGKKIVYNINETKEKNQKKGAQLKEFLDKNRDKYEDAFKYFEKSDDPFNQEAHFLFANQLKHLYYKEKPEEPILKIRTDTDINKAIVIDFDLLRAVSRSTRSTSVYENDQYFDSMRILGQILKEQKVQAKDNITLIVRFSNGSEFKFEDKNMYDNVTNFLKAAKDLREMQEEYDALDRKAEQLLDEKFCSLAGSSKFIKPINPGNQNLNFEYREQPTPDQEQLYEQLQQTLSRQQAEGMQMPQISALPVKYNPLIQPYFICRNAIEFVDGKCIITFDGAISSKGQFVSQSQINHRQEVEVQPLQKTQLFPFAKAFENDRILLKNYQMRIDLDRFEKEKNYFSNYEFPAGLSAEESYMQALFQENSLTVSQIIEQQQDLIDEFFKFDEDIHMQRMRRFYYKLEENIYEHYKSINDGQRPMFLEDIQRDIEKNKRTYVSPRRQLVQLIIKMLQLVLRETLFISDLWNGEHIHNESSIMKLFQPLLEQPEGIKFGTNSFWGSVLYIKRALTQWLEQYRERMNEYCCLRVGSIFRTELTSEQAFFCVQYTLEEEREIDSIMQQDIFTIEYRRKGYPFIPD